MHAYLVYSAFSSHNLFLTTYRPVHCSSPKFFATDNCPRNRCTYSWATLLCCIWAQLAVQIHVGQHHWSCWNQFPCLLRFWAGYLSLYCDEWEWWTNLLTVHCYQRRYIFSLLVSTKCIGKKLRIENTHHLFRCTSFQSTDQCIIFFLMHHSRFVVSQILPGRH